MDKISVSFCKAAKIFSYFTFPLLLPLAVILPHYSVHDSRFCSEFLDVQNVWYLENYILKIFPYFLQENIISRPQLNLSWRRSCKPKISLWWYNWTILSNLGYQQISTHSVSNNTPIWSLIKSKILQEIREISDRRYISNSATFLVGSLTTWA